MKKHKLLPKGHAVRYAMMVKSGDMEATLEDLKNDDKLADTPWMIHPDGTGTILIDGFVSGDTEELGLSVVALENPLVCLISTSPGKSLRIGREMCRTGFIDQREFFKQIGLDISQEEGSLSCQYS